MSTGIESWKNLSEIGPIYPFVGTETILVMAGLIIWVIWHVLQISSEKKHHEEAKAKFKKGKGG